MRSNIFDPKFKRSILNKIRATLFDDAYHEFVNRQQNICLKHAQISPRKQSAFRFKGTLYFHPAHAFTRPVDRLAEELEEEQRQLLIDKAKFEKQEEGLINAYLTNALNLCTTPNDMLAVFPEQLHGVFKKYIEKYLSQYELTVHAAKLVPFNRRHQLHIDLLKQRLMLNILLK